MLPPTANYQRGMSVKARPQAGQNIPLPVHHSAGTRRFQPFRQIESSSHRDKLTRFTKETASESTVSDLKHLTALAAFSDNYIWTWHNDAHIAFVVDPGDARPVQKHLQANGLTLGGILVTHHHPDHVAGIHALTDGEPNIPVYGPRNSPFAGITQPLRDGDRIQIGGLAFHILETPGHTLDHICYWNPEALFSGDTLFAGGCGRLFEGTPQQMLNSLNRLAALPPETPVYCTHEYTLANLRFARAVRPNHAATEERLLSTIALRDSDTITLPSTIGNERSTNPFLCSSDPKLRERLQAQGFSVTDDVTAFASLRSWKDNF